MQLFAGKFWSCTDNTVANVKECVGFDNSTGVPVAREWKNHHMNFDNFVQSYLTLFQVATLELWLEPMNMAIPYFRLPLSSCG